ncbi:LytR/AlgR family response regulator transcription factor [Natranaerovirga hydrolytica]|uniref:LytR/AlgR family response regulator transcription factor n=1 Tax=Natranaerovirga hydrolytica TaxID=680378 RepID=UPI001046E698|nr:LytTR family DNA-binding domain-containing protein [Natranaerovirga hydrolytica]
MITTHVYYQLEAFKNLHCYDFIEKPYESDTVIKVTEKVLGGFKRLEQFLDSNNASVGFQLKHCLLKIDIDDILFIESHRRDCIVHTYNKVHSLPGYTMKKVLEIINKPYVMKTHKSYIINLKNIYEVEKIDRNSWIVYFEDYQEEALVSNTFKQEFSQKIAQEKRKEV